MTKSLTKIWLRGFKRLMTNLPKAQGEYLRDVTKKQRRTRSAPAKSAERPVRGEAPASRVRPRAAAWAKGQWTRSYHSAPSMPGRLVNHLTYGLYVPPERSTVQMPLVVMLHGCKQTIDELAAGTRMNLLADTCGFAVVYPEQSKHAHAHRCWHWYDDRDSAGHGERVRSSRLSMRSSMSTDSTRSASMSRAFRPGQDLRRCSPCTFRSGSRPSGSIRRRHLAKRIRG